MINVIIVFLFTSLLHETEQFVEELSSPRIGVDFVQLQHWQINKFNDGIRSNLIVGSLSYIFELFIEVMTVVGIRWGVSPVPRAGGRHGSRGHWCWGGAG